MPHVTLSCVLHHVCLEEFLRQWRRAITLPGSNSNHYTSDTNNTPNWPFDLLFEHKSTIKWSLFGTLATNSEIRHALPQFHAYSIPVISNMAAMWQGRVSRLLNEVKPRSAGFIVSGWQKFILITRAVIFFSFPFQGQGHIKDYRTPALNIVVSSICRITGSPS